ncbi:MAG: cbb3-type cytochrome oxidase assembly protein [Verrucomicrobiota bacterium]|nr:cbb3-type cytochrome oxidase assembly protein [Verrucomicrobiota bacterium]
MSFITIIATSLKQVEWPTSINDVNPFFIVIIGGMLFFGASALWAFYWAAKKGHFENFQRQSEEIFAKDEPIGTVTDQFPVKKKK